MILETDRLYLREFVKQDFKALCNILQDPKVMYAYEHAFNLDECHAWLEKQLTRYKEDGFGLWAVVLKKSDIVIGQCGLSLQDIDNTTLLEIGYLFNQSYWHQGFAIEAAQACKQYAFSTLHAKEVYSIIRDTNIASKNVAIKNGMVKIKQITKHYYNIDMPHDIYVVKNDNYNI